MNIEQQRETLLAEIERLSQVESLLLQPGWSVLSEHFEKTKEVICDALLVETDLSKIVRLQERHRAFNEVLAAVKAFSEAKENLIQDLQNTESEQKTRNEYGLN